MAGAEQADGAVPPYAGFGARAIAAMLDGLLGLAALVPAILVFLIGPSHTVDCDVDGVTTPCTQPTGGTITTAAAFFGIGLVGYLLWFSRRAGESQSVGQGVGKVRIVDVDTGAPIGWQRAFTRQLAKLISLIPLGLGFWWMAWDPRRQCWHDKIAGTVVVDH